MAVAVERLTADEYLARDDPRRTELIDGLVIVNAPSLHHQRVCARIFAALDAWARSSGVERHLSSAPRAGLRR